MTVCHRQKLNFNLIFCPDLVDHYTLALSCRSLSRLNNLIWHRLQCCQVYSGLWPWRWIRSMRCSVAKSPVSSRLRQTIGFWVSSVAACLLGPVLPWRQWGVNNQTLNKAHQSAPSALGWQLRCHRCARRYAYKLVAPSSNMG